MKKPTRNNLVLLQTLFLFICTQAFGQTDPGKLWKPYKVSTANLPETSLRPGLPALDKGAAFELNMTAMKALGKTAKKESDGIANNTAIVWLPLPNGVFQRFQIWESPLMEPELAAKYPEISTYLLKGLDDPTSNGRMMISPDEFSAFFASLPNRQETIIRKIFKTDVTKYLSFRSKDDPAREEPVKCLRKNEAPSEEPQNGADQSMLAGVNETGDGLRVFRHAMTVIGALSQQQGWTTKGQALAGVVSFLSQINTIYERDVSIRFVLPVGEDQLIFLDDATDPFVTNGGDGTLYENQMLTDQLVGTENYDLGLVFVLGGCCGNRGAPCNATRAQNISAYNGLQVTTHEIGHALSCSHTWTSCGPSNNGQFGTNEYGSGTSIMSYVGICGVDNILPTGDITFFGVYSQIQITNFLSTSSCYKTLPTGNHVPVATVPASGFYIPVSTPFELVGSATDVDGDNLTYSWEQTNIRNVDFTASTISIQVPPTPADGNVPIARIFNPVTTPRRTIPQLSDLLANNSTVYERLPTYTRNIKYRLYVRDNHPGAGGTTPPQVSFEVDGTAGPFLVTAPNTPVSWASPSSQTVTWNVANTTNANVNCQNVKISLSVDGGYNYVYVLAASTANDGTQSVAIPAGINTGKARIKIEAVGNIFFDICNTNFTIGTPVAAQANVAALDFDGSNDQVNLANNFGNFGTGNFTIEMWVKTSDPSYGVLISKRATCSCGNFWNFFVEAGKFHAEFSEAGCANILDLAGVTTVSDGNWHHLAATRSGTTLTLYVDGTPDATGTFAHNINNSANVILGNSPCNGYFTGSMDEIRIWNVTRTQAEITNAQYCRLNGTEPGLTALYHADDGTPNAVNTGVTLFDDATANNYNGTYSGFALSGTSSNFVGPFTDALYTASGSITITGQPASQSGTVGQTITLTVAVTENVTYQWQAKPNGSGNFVDISGATASSLALTMAPALHNNQYRCVVRNGCNMLNSNAATLTLTCTAQTLSAITGDGAPCQDNYYTYFVDPNANIVTWNWTTPAGWTVANYGNMIFVKPNGTAGNVTVSGTNACGNTTGIQTKAVAPVLVEITTQPVSQAVSEGVAVNFTVAVSNGGGTTTYQWQQSTDFGASFSDIPGAIAATYNIASASVAHDDRRFRCIVSNSCLKDTSNVVMLDVNCTGSGPATPGSISGADLICAGAVLTYSVTVIPGASGYTWTLPSGWTGSSTTNSITVTANSTGGILNVKAVNACGMSAERGLSIAINNADCQRAVHFDGVNDYLAVAQNSQAIQGDMTISFWVKPDRLTGMQTLIFNGKEFVVNLNGNRIQYQHSDNCCGYDGTVDKIFSASLSTGAWYFVALTRSPANRSISLYLNGNFVETLTYGGAFAQPGDNTTSTMNFGSGINGDYLHFKGALDEIKIWNAIRSATQIREDMFCVPAGNESNLKAYYGFEQGQPGGNNVAITEFTNAASAYLGAAVRNLAMTGPTSNVTDGSKGSAISGPSAICSGGGTITYTIDLPGTPTVTWTLPSGWTGSSTTESITVTPGANGGVITAQAVLSCGTVRLEKAVSTTPSLVNTTLLGGKALDFDGSNDYVQVPSSAINLANSSMTIEFWAKRGANGAQDFVVAQGNTGANTRLVIGFRNTNQFTFAFWSNDLNTTTTYTDNGWHHWACVYDNAIASPNNNRFIYRDGVLVAGDRSGSNFTGSGALDIGRLDSDFFGGQVDELRIWNIARSPAQIVAGLYCPVTCAPSSLVLYLPMENGTANGNNTGLTGLQDYSSYTQSNTLNGFALSGATSNFVMGGQGSLFADNDNDGYGNPAMPITSCPTGNFAANNADCNDNNNAINPYATEVCGNGVDDDCDGNTDAEVNKGLHFNGSGHSVTIPFVAHQSVFTVEAWVKTSYQGTNNIVRWTGSSINVSFEIYFDGTIGYFDGTTGYAQQGPNLSDNQWHHVALVHNGYAGTNVRAYVDGVERWAAAFPSVITNTAVKIGDGFNGNMDEVRFWGTALTQTQIQSRMNRRLDGNEANLVRYYMFDHGKPGQNNAGLTILKDKTPNNGHGTLNGFVLTGVTSNWVTSWTYPTLYADGDNDGFGGAAAWTCGSMTGSKMHNLDCNDAANAIKPDATEICGNGTDENCNGVTDENNLWLHFDGTNDYVSFGNTLGNFGTGDFTIEARFKTTAATRYLLSKRPTCGCDNLFNISVNSAGKMRIEMYENASCGNGGALDGTTTVNDGNWHHFAFVRKSGVLSVFVDGSPENSTTLTTNLNNPAVLSLGGNNPCGAPFSGEVDELHLWNIARTPEEINTFKNASLPAAVTGLIANYDFNNPTAIAGGNNAGKTLLDDRTANNFDGTLTNFALTGATSNWLGNPGGTTTIARVKVFLQGPYVSAVQLMHDSLRVKNLIPLTEPYTGLTNFTHLGGGGGETTTPALLAVTGANAIVDWVFLELRSAANPALVLATRSALLQRDGDVVNADGVSSVTFGVAANQSYFLVVRHRNHFGVQTGVAGVYPSCVTVETDFRGLPPGGFYAFNGLNAAEKTVDSKFVLWAGNGRVDYQLKYNGSNNDRNTILSTVGLSTPNAVVAGYLLADYNLDGQVKYNGSANDRNVLLGNVGITTPSAILYDQIGQ